MSLVHNERKKLLANLLNNMASACFAVGIIAPAAKAFETGGTAANSSWVGLLASFFAWLVAVIALHLSAMVILGGLRDD